MCVCVFFFGGGSPTNNRLGVCIRLPGHVVDQDSKSGVLASFFLLPACAGVQYYRHGIVLIAARLKFNMNVQH